MTFPSPKSRAFVECHTERLLSPAIHEISWHRNRCSIPLVRKSGSLPVKRVTTDERVRIADSQWSHLENSPCNFCAYFSL